MSEKRFIWEYDDGQWGGPLFYDDGKKLCFDEVVDLLNEQQATIDRLKNAIRIAYEEKPYPTIEDIKAKYKEYDEI